MTGCNCLDINCDILHLMAFANQFIHMECNSKTLTVSEWIVLWENRNIVGAFIRV
jgi:hypothetical protein